MTNILRRPLIDSEPAIAGATAELVRSVAELEARLAEAPATRPVVPGDVRRLLAARYDLDAPRPLADLAADLYEILFNGIVHSNHPRHFGLFVPGVRPAGVVGDTLAALLNPQVGSWGYAPAAAEIESFVLDALAAKIGFDPAEGAAHFTSGGSEANATAVVLALTRAFPAYREAGLAGLPRRPLLYASEAAHDSFVKIAHISGLGRVAVRRVQIDGRQRMVMADLRRQVERDRRAGAAPFLVVGTAGTTAAGAFDPLPELADFCREGGLALHVDAAWGGLALLVGELHGLAAGIEQADTVTWDAHKVFPIPTAAGMFFARSRAGLGTAFGVETGYVPEAAEGTADLYQCSLQWSRRCIGLKVFLTVAELGWRGIAALLRHQVAMGWRLREKLARTGFELRNDSPLPLVCFTHPAIVAGRRTADEVVAELLRRGRVWISAVRLAAGEPKALRACITSHRTEPDDLHVLVDELAAAIG